MSPITIKSKYLSVDRTIQQPDNKAILWVPIDTMPPSWNDLFLDLFPGSTADPGTPHLVAVRPGTDEPTPWTMSPIVAVPAAPLWALAYATKISSGCEIWLRFPLASCPSPLGGSWIPKDTQETPIPLVSEVPNAQKVPSDVPQAEEPPAVVLTSASESVVEKDTKEKVSKEKKLVDEEEENAEQKKRAKTLSKLSLKRPIAVSSMRVVSAEQAAILFPPPVLTTKKERKEEKEEQNEDCEEERGKEKKEKEKEEIEIKGVPGPKLVLDFFLRDEEADNKEWQLNMQDFTVLFASSRSTGTPSSSSSAAEPSATKPHYPSRVRDSMVGFNALPIEKRKGIVVEAMLRRAITCADFANIDPDMTLLAIDIAENLTAETRKKGIERIRLLNAGCNRIGLRLPSVLGESDICPGNIVVIPDPNVSSYSSSAATVTTGSPGATGTTTSSTSTASTVTTPTWLPQGFTLGLPAMAYHNNLFNQLGGDNVSVHVTGLASARARPADLLECICMVYYLQTSSANCIAKFTSGLSAKFSACSEVSIQDPELLPEPFKRIAHPDLFHVDDYSSFNDSNEGIRIIQLRAVFNAPSDVVNALGLGPDGPVVVPRPSEKSYHCPPGRMPIYKTAALELPRYHLDLEKIRLTDVNCHPLTVCAPVNITFNMLRKDSRRLLLALSMVHRAQTASCFEDYSASGPEAPIAPLELKQMAYMIDRIHRIIICGGARSVSKNEQVTISGTQYGLRVLGKNCFGHVPFYWPEAFSYGQIIVPLNVSNGHNYIVGYPVLMHYSSMGVCGHQFPMSQGNAIMSYPGEIRSASLFECVSILSANMVRDNKWIHLNGL